MNPEPFEGKNDLKCLNCTASDLNQDWGSFRGKEKEEEEKEEGHLTPATLYSPNAILNVCMLNVKLQLQMASKGHKV